MPDEMSWAEAVEVSKASFDEIEQRRDALAAAEAANLERSEPTFKENAEDLNSTERLRRELDTMREVAQGNKRHVAYLTEENDRLRAEVARVQGEAEEKGWHRGFEHARRYPDPAELARVRAQVAEELADLRTRAFDAESALVELVRLKDGPHDADYERAKPIAWSRARAVVAQIPTAPAEPVGEATTPPPGTPEPSTALARLADALSARGVLVDGDVVDEAIAYMDRVHDRYLREVDARIDDGMRVGLLSKREHGYSEPEPPADTATG